MSFISFEFFGALLVCALFYYWLPARFRTWFLLIVSYGFYATWKPLNLLLLLGTSAAVYWLGLRIAASVAESRKKLFLWSGVALMAGLIVGFKLAGALHGVLLPLGLSYYAFKLLSYLIDVYWDEGEVERDPVLVFLYPAFFPQIVSGPIQRSGDFFTQMRRSIGARADFAQIDQGFRLILGGLMMKLLIGDRIGAFIDIVDRSPGDYTWPILVTTIACYTLQLYADFSGYTNIAIGIGKMFGIDSPPNFAAPFAAPNIQEMWRRWHMSLTSWVTDYMFSPLQMALRDWGQLGLMICIIVNMVVIGLWHGLTLNFLVFGLLHAAYVLVTALTRRARDRVFGGPRRLLALRVGIGVPLTFALMSFSQIFWHTPTWAAATQHLRQFLGFAPSGQLTWTDIREDVADPIFVCMAISFFFGAGAPGTRWLRRLATNYLPNWVEYGFYLLLISALTIEAGSTFIYGQF